MKGALASEIRSILENPVCSLEDIPALISAAENMAEIGIASEHDLIPVIRQLLKMRSSADATPSTIDNLRQEMLGLLNSSDLNA